MKFNSKITKEEVNQLEPVEFEGEVVLIDKKEKLPMAIYELNMQDSVGIDTETRPSFSRGVYYNVSLLQISTDNKCYLFRLNKIGFPKELLDFLSNSRIRKIGLSLHDDFLSLRKRGKINPANFIDIQNIVKDYGILELSLQKIYAVIFNKKISKSQRLSNWERDALTKQQIKYAATDAWACLKIYHQLQTEKKISKKELKELESLQLQPLAKPYQTADAG
ncbi:MAG: 3'-5' exonuclease [Paludibacteraceae bacterium]